MPHLRRLWLRAFRNYALADLVIGDGTIVFLGANGQGKSNLLEAIYLVATGRSHRTASEAEIIQRGETAARVRAHISRRGREEELEITITVDGDRIVSQMRVNGVVTPRGSVLGRLPVVLAAPWDLELVRGPGSGRRRLLDGALAQLSPAYFFALHRYHRVVTQRNAELRQRGRAGGVASGLDAWDAQLVELGARITGHRTAYVERLRPHVTAWFERLGGSGALTLGYRPSWQGDSDDERSADARAQMSRLRVDEYRRGVTLSGPHRDDLEYALDGYTLRAYGSQGQWRTAMLAVRLAERAAMAAEIGASPVLLLDDALAELDPQRQRRVLEIGGEAQTLATATSLPGLERVPRLFTIEAGNAMETAWSPQFGTS
ncbi:MAG: DNA replication/repair protein RecF [Armatimonadota bacterium]